MKLLFVVNVDWFFCSHRLPVAIAAIRSGYEVHLATSFTSRKLRAKFSQLGIIVHDLSLNRSGSNPLALLKTFLEIFRIVLFVRPSIVHLVTIQPVLLGGLACRAARVSRVVFAISGLGHVFVSDSLFSRIRRALVEKFYRIALSVRRRLVLFQI